MQELYRTIGWLAFFTTIIVAWWIMYAMSQDMAMMDMSDVSGMSMSADSPLQQMMTSFSPLFIMWAIMMAAMMLPPLVPALGTYEALIKSADATRRGWWGLLAGFSLCWIGFAFIIALFQLAAFKMNVLDMMGQTKSLWVSAALTLFIGVYQFSGLKQTCQGVCYAPLQYFMRHWDPSGQGGLKMGGGLGAYCIGCCWGLMMLGFVAGVMSLLWMGVVTLIIILEKIPQIGIYVRKPVGFGLIGLGLYLANSAFLQLSEGTVF